MLKKISSGRWFFPVKDEGVYNISYIKKYMEYENTETGKDLTKKRVSFCVKNMINYLKPFDIIPKMVDVGVGSGDFLRKMGCFGFDVNEHAKYMLQQEYSWVNIWDKFEAGTTKVWTFWDSLEHIEHIEKLLSIIKSGALLFISIPILPEGTEVESWKHFRTDEHYHYFTDYGFRNFMKNQGFKLIDKNTMEQESGRQDINTYGFIKDISASC